MEAGRLRSVVAGPGWRGRVGAWSCGDWHALLTCHGCKYTSTKATVMRLWHQLPSLTQSCLRCWCSPTSWSHISPLPSPPSPCQTTRYSTPPTSPPLSTLPLHTCTHPSHQVTYENHRHFSSSHKKPKPSPVRIFTNLPPPGLRLPPAEGYR